MHTRTVLLSRLYQKRRKAGGKGRAACPMPWTASAARSMRFGWFPTRTRGSAAPQPTARHLPSVRSASPVTVPLGRPLPGGVCCVLTVLLKPSTASDTLLAPFRRPFVSFGTVWTVKLSVCACCGPILIHFSTFWVYFEPF